MKYILVIDDERVFPAFEAEDTLLAYARTSEEAIARLIRLTPWDEVWFDHDLGLDDDAMKVVKWMENNRDKWVVERAYVHTMNPVGAVNIRSRVKDLGIPTYRTGLPEGHAVL